MMAVVVMVVMVMAMVMMIAMVMVLAMLVWWCVSGSERVILDGTLLMQ